MRFLLLAMFSALLLSGCAVEFETGYYRHGHHPGHHRGHHRHYWNHAGEVYSEAVDIHSLVVMPVKLPAVFKGQFSSPEEEHWRKEWPMKGARILAQNLAKTDDIHVAATSSDKQPTEGYYLLLEIVDFDAGSREATSTGTNDIEGWCYLLATGRIYNAKSGKEVVTLIFEASTGRYSESPPFDALMFNVAFDLRDWFREKQAKARSGS